MPEKNIKLLNLTMDFIKTTPVKHDQSTWVSPCGSTMCFAGHAAVLDGAQFNEKLFKEIGDWRIDTETKKHTRSWESISVSSYARKALGLDWDEADYLFEGGRTVEELEEAVRKFSAGMTVDSCGNFYNPDQD